MSERDFYTPAQLDALRMENELLAFEVRFLRAQTGMSGKGRSASTPLNRIAHLEEAEQDLVLLVRRMSSSRVGSLLRRKKAFRTLEERYLSPEGRRNRSANQLAYLEGAERDLVLLLRRMGSSLLGPAFRRKREFRTLEQRYL